MGFVSLGWCPDRITWAEKLDLSDAVKLLDETLAEEKKTDEALTKTRHSQLRGFLDPPGRLAIHRRSFKPRSSSHSFQFRSTSAYVASNVSALP